MGSDQRKLLKAIAAQGFTVTKSGKGHFIVRASDGTRVCTIALTASDHRSISNAIAVLRRSGFIWPRK